MTILFPGIQFRWILVKSDPGFISTLQSMIAHGIEF